MALADMMPGMGLRKQYLCPLKVTDLRTGEVYLSIDIYGFIEEEDTSFSIGVCAPDMDNMLYIPLGHAAWED